MASAHPPKMVSGLADLASGYRAVLCDVWGVLHNGEAAWRGAFDALQKFRAGGGVVILVTNAPRRRSYVVDQVLALGVPADAFDDVVTSGDVTRERLAAMGAVGVYHIGTDGHLPLYEGLEVELVADDRCEVISCTALFNDEVETPEDYADRLAAWQGRGVPMLCANPDIQVERGGRLIWCAGALAERFAALGGTTEVVGKPHDPIYRMAFEKLGDRLGAPVSSSDVLAIGDGVETDVRGAARQGMDALFISGGVHASEFGNRHEPDPDRIEAFLDRTGVGAHAVMPALVWQKL